MKSFSKSTILGLAFGILLAFGVAVFAFQSPTQPPPQGNVPAPLNTGPTDQTKTGGLLQVFGLWVNQSLGVSGGATLGGILNLQGNRIINVGTPTEAGEVATKGYADSVAGGADLDLDGLIATGQGGTDCDDTCPSCFPGSSYTTTYPDARDQNCNGLKDEDTSPSKTCTISSAFVLKSTLDSTCNARCGGSGTVTCGDMRTEPINIRTNFNWSTCTAAGPDSGGTACNSISVTCTCPPVYR